MSRAADLASVGAGIASAANATAISISATEVVTLLTSALATSEGGAVTTNIAQGLLKCFLTLNGTGTIAILDSFNITSVADNATGTYTVTIANDFASVNYGWAGTGENNNDGQTSRGVSGISQGALAGSTEVFTALQSNNAAEDLINVKVGWWGDLA